MSRFQFTIPVFLAPWVIVVCAGGCGPKKGPEKGPPPPLAQTSEAVDFGDDWAKVEEVLTGSRPGEITSGAPNTTPSGWALVLCTFQGPAAASEAALYQHRAAAMAPELAQGLSHHRTKDGWMVTYGTYGGWDDPLAMDDSRRIRAFTANGTPLFPQAMLADVAQDGDVATLHPWDLRIIRRMHPDVEPLYTLNVAVWGEFDGGGVTEDERRNKAQGYAATLRARGYEAFFHHDEARGLSDVTIGVFDKRALDVRSGLMSSEVVNLIRDFPQRLINGEPLMESVSPIDAEHGFRAQEPRLVLVQ